MNSQPESFTLFNMFNIETFSNPPAKFKGTDFWMLDDALSDDAIDVQLSRRKHGHVGIRKKTSPCPCFSLPLILLQSFVHVKYGFKGLYNRKNNMIGVDVNDENTRKVTPD